MRRSPLFLLPLLMLAGCVDESASYFINGSDHALTLRVEQPYFWSDDASVALIASRWPDCQRRIALTTEPVADLNVELFASGDNVFTLRSGKQIWQVETNHCTQLPDPAGGASGTRLGSFKMQDKKMVFEAEGDAAANAAAAGPADDGAAGAAPEASADAAAAPAASDSAAAAAASTAASTAVPAAAAPTAGK